MAPSTTDLADGDLVAVAEAVGRMVRARTSDVQLGEDVAQETMARVIARQDGLARDALLPYALVTARNLLASTFRQHDVARRHEHQLLDLRGPDSPEERAVTAEEHRSMRDALGRLSDRERDALLAHHVEGVGLGQLAVEGRTTAGAIAVRLATLRAKLRVEYVLASADARPPTPKCRPVLVALSAGDRRRQRALDAGDHLLDCATCSRLSEPLLRRERALAAWWPVPLAGPAATLLLRAAKEHPARTTASISVAVGLGAGGAALLAGGQPAPAPAPPATAAPLVAAPSPEPEPEADVEVDGQPVLPLLDGSAADRALDRFAGRPVVVREASVLAVDADEGFWIGVDATSRLWVQLLAPAESVRDVEAGQLVSFDGTLVPHGPGFAASVGVDPAEGAAQLDGLGHHVEVSHVAMVITG